MRHHPAVLAAAVIAGALVCAAPAFALDMPQRKAGLWQLKMKFEGRNLPGRTMQQCIDAKTDKMMNSDFGGDSPGHSCAQRRIKPSPGGFTVDSTCTFNGATTTSHAVISGDFNSAYTVHVTSTRHGGPPMPGRAGGATSMTLSAKWLGPCRAGQRPGDIMMGNGMKMNIFDLSKMGHAPTPRH